MIEQTGLPCDGHIHTYLCGHARGTMEEYVQAAIERGLQEIIFLEHFEIGIAYFERTWLSQDDFLSYQQEGERLQQRYGGQLQIGIGVEIGYNPDFLAETRDFISSYPWQRVGLSYHFLAQPGGHINMVSRKEVNVDALAELGEQWVLQRYLEGLAEGLGSLPVDVVCHLDAALRFSAPVAWSATHKQLVEQLLQLMADKGVGLEINTSGLALGRDVFPAAWIRELAKKRGVHLLYGSDAHRPEDVGRYFEQFA